MEKLYSEKLKIQGIVGNFGKVWNLINHFSIDENYSHLCPLKPEIELKKEENGLSNDQKP